MRVRGGLAAAVLAAASLLLPVSPASADAHILGQTYRDVCRAEEHPKWSYGREGTPVTLKALFGCDERFGARRDADERLVEQLQESGLEGAALSDRLVQDGWKWLGGRRLPVALNRFNLAFEADPDNGDVYHGIAVVMAESGQPETIIDYWFNVGTEQPRGHVGRFADYGRFLTMSGRLSEARPVLERALEVEPGHAWAMMNLATLHFQQDQLAEGCAIIDRLQQTPAPAGFPEEKFDEIKAGWRDRADRAGCG